MSRVGKVVKKLVAGEFSELSGRAREELLRRRERRHYQRQGDLFTAADYSRIFTDGFREQFSRADGDLDFVAALRAKEDHCFFPGFSRLDHFRSAVPGRLPRQAQRLIETADQVTRDRFPIFSLGYLDYGDPPRWNFDPVHQRMAPESFYGGIEYLKPDVAGDVKVIWELSRLQFVYDLGQAYLLTGDRKYADKFFELICAWSEYHRDFHGVGFCSALEFAFRVHSLCWGVFFFKDSGALDQSRARAVYRLLYLGAKFLNDHLSLWFSPNTHLFGEAYGLFLFGLLFPEFADSNRRLTDGVTLLLAEIDKQINADGMHAELTPAYHAYMLEFALSAQQLADANGMKLPARFREKLAAMTNLFASLQRPDGRWPHVGDEDGGRLYWLSRAPAGDYQAILEACRFHFEQTDREQDGAGNLEAFWLTGASIGRQRASGNARKRQAPSFGTRILADSGMAVCRSPRLNMYSLFQGGVFGYGPCPHSHADMLQLDVSVGDDNFIVDPGTFLYTGDLAARNHYRSAAAHNGPYVAGMSFVKPDDPFAWKEKPEVRLNQAVGAAGFGYLSASWQGRAAEVGGFKTVRELFFLGDGFWIVKDLVVLDRPTAVEWRFTSPFGVEQAGGSVLIEGQQSRLLLMPFTFENDLPRLSVEGTGISEDYLSQTQARALVATSTAASRHEVLWLLAPLFGEQVGPNAGQLRSTPASVCFRFTDLQGEHQLWFGPPQEDAESGLAGDGLINYLLLADGSCRRLIICHGRTLRLRSQVLLETRSATEYVDMRLTDRGYQVDAAIGTKLLTPSEDKITR